MSGETASLVQNLLSSEHGVVILGQSGAGKSTLADTLVAEYAEKSRLDTWTPAPVPMVVRLSTWDPSQVTLLDHAASQIRQSLREFGLQRVSMKELKIAVRSREARLVLDELDELTDEQVGLALRDIDDVHGLAPVLLSQPLTEGVRGLPSSRFRQVELLPISAGAAAEALTSCVPSGAGAADWLAVVSVLERSPNTEPALLLRTPLFLSVAMDAVTRGESPPHALSHAAFDRDHAERELLQSFVTNAAKSPRRSERRQMRALRTIAWLMRRGNLESIDWIALGRATPWWITAPSIAVAVALPLLIVQSATPALNGLALYAGGAALVTLSTLGDRASLMRPRIGRVRRAPIRFAVTSTAVLVVANSPVAWTNPSMLLGFLIVGGIMWLLAALVLVLIAQIGSEFASFERWWVSSGFDSRTPNGVGWSVKRRSLYVALALGGFAALGYAIVSGFSGGSGQSGVGETDALREFANSFSWVARLFTLEAAAIFVGMTALALFAVTFGRALSKSSSWRRGVLSNIFYGFVKALLIAALVLALPITATVLGSPDASSFYRMFGPAPLTIAVQIVGLAVIVLGPAGLVGGVVTSGMRYVAGSTVLMVAGRLPIRLERFLREMAIAGVLRRSGQGYRFRHARLRDCVLTPETTPRKTREDASRSSPVRD